MKYLNFQEAQMVDFFKLYISYLDTSWKPTVKLTWPSGLRRETQVLFLIWGRGFKPHCQHWDTQQHQLVDTFWRILKIPFPFCFRSESKMQDFEPVLFIYRIMESLKKVKKKTEQRVSSPPSAWLLRRNRLTSAVISDASVAKWLMRSPCKRKVPCSIHGGGTNHWKHSN